LALYRHGQLEEAREALVKAVELRPTEEPGDHFALAMVLWQQGREEEALAQYRRATARIEEIYRDAPDAHVFREEVARLIGVEP
jgi:tetratricopeptide (TPR) repeat protein